MARSSVEGSVYGGREASRGGEFSIFEHKRKLFNMDNTIFSLTWAHATAGGSNSMGVSLRCRCPSSL